MFHHLEQAVRVNGQMALYAPIRKPTLPIPPQCASRKTGPIPVWSLRERLLYLRLQTCPMTLGFWRMSSTFFCEASQQTKCLS